MNTLDILDAMELERDQKKALLALMLSKRGDLTLNEIHDIIYEEK